MCVIVKCITLKFVKRTFINEGIAVQCNRNSNDMLVAYTLTVVCRNLFNRVKKVKTPSIFDIL